MATFIGIVLLVPLFILAAVFIALFVSIADLRGKVKTLEERLNAIGAPVPKQAVKTMPAAQPKQAAPAAQQTQPAPQPQPEPKPAEVKPVPVAAAAAPKPAIAAVKATSVAEPVKKEPLNLAKIFAWTGGFALFLGMVFFVKYSIENNLISETMRVISSGLLGAALLAAGFIMKGEKYKITADTFCGSGLAIMYAAAYAAHSFYNLIPVSAAFVIMGVISVSSFYVAVKKDVKYIGYLGVVIAFLAPILLSTGVDRPFVLFGFLGIVNIAAFATGVKNGWSRLIQFCLGATFLMQFGWMLEHYTLAKTVTMVCIFAVYVTVVGLASYRFKVKGGNAYVLANLSFPLMAVLTNIGAISNVNIVEILLFTLLINVLMAALFVHRPKENATPFQIATGASAAILMLWTPQAGQAVLALTSYLIFTIINVGISYLFPKTDEAFKNGNKVALAVPFLFMISIATFMLGNNVFTVLPFLFVLAAMGIFNAIKYGYKGWLYAYAIMAAWVLLAFILEAKSDFVINVSLGASIVLSPMMFIFTFFARKTVVAKDMQNVSVVTTIVPFLMLVAALFQFDGHVGTLYFVYSLVIALVAAGFALKVRNYEAVAVGAVGMFVVQAAYYIDTHTSYIGASFFIWVSIAVFIYALLPFIWMKKDENKYLWATAALFPAAAFILLYISIKRLVPQFHLSLLPVLFTAFFAPAAVILYKADKTKKMRLGFIGGAALFFINCFLPLEFSKNWLTISLALEGLALAGLAKFIDYKTLEKVAFAAFAAVFIRLCCNPFVLGYHPTGIKIFNWMLGAYGVSALAMFGADMLYTNEKLKRITNLFGVAALFVLVNLQIADWYSTGRYMNFEIFGRFAVTVSYTLAWGIFGTLLVAAGFMLNSKYARYIGIALISVASGKLFLSDIWYLETLYRVIALVGMAVLLIGVSFAYQKAKKSI
ncbi:putative membrane protein [Elusimicrobium simillimum]|uniref:DUF2339 domain-containing protein n=1 Tax=Elusimicrobium simillimum TaxID=3143438 RepID=UPI003C6F48F3